MKPPIKVRNIRGKNFEDQTLDYFVKLAEDAGYKPVEVRFYACPYKSETPCYEIVLEKGSDFVRVCTSIHSFQFFVSAKGIHIDSNLHPTPHYYAKLEYTAFLTELYPILEKSILVKKLFSKITDKTGYNFLLKRFRRRRNIVRIFQIVALFSIVNNERKER